VLGAVALLAGCSAGGEGEQALDGLGTPQFEPDTSEDAATSTQPAAVEGGPASSSPTTAAAGEGSAETTTTVAGAAPEATAPREIVQFDDPLGDVVGGLDDDPPRWADLAGVSLERQGNAYRLVVRLGDAAPESAPGAATMNVATFFDVDGDGGIDHELWVNLGPDGWGPTWWTGDRAHPGEASNVTVAVEGDELRLLFPDVMLDQPDRFRFSLASEYGDLEVIGSSYAHRDDAPDGDQAVSFP